MKSIYSVILFVALSGVALASDSDVGAPDPSVGSAIASKIMSADHAKASYFDEKSPDHPKTVVIRDKKWIESFAGTVRAGVFSPRMHIFAVSEPVVFLDRRDHVCTSIEPLPGNTLRVGGDDYQVDDSTMKAIAALLNAKKPKGA